MAMRLGKPKDVEPTKLMKTGDNTAIAPTKLNSKVYELMKFITNKELMTKAVVDAGFDVKKLPLGELSQESLAQADKILKNIEDALK